MLHIYTYTTLGEVVLLLLVEEDADKLDIVHSVKEVVRCVVSSDHDSSNYLTHEIFVLVGVLMMLLLYWASMHYVW